MCMQTIGDNIYVNIKELPTLDEVNPGDFLIIETDNGTNIIDFQNFLITPDNTTFYGEIENLNTKVEDLSASNAEEHAALQDTTNLLLTSFNTVDNRVTTLFDNLTSTYSPFLVKGGVTFNGQDTDQTDGVNCFAQRSTVGTYSVVFNQNIAACNITSNADKVLLLGVQGNTATFQTLSCILNVAAGLGFTSGGTSLNGPLSALRDAFPDGDIYNPADVTLISVIGI